MQTTMTSRAIFDRSSGEGQFAHDDDDDDKNGRKKASRKRRRERRSSIPSSSAAAFSTPLRRTFGQFSGSSSIVTVTFSYYLALVWVSNCLPGIAAQAPTLDATFLYNIPAGGGSESHCYDDRGNAQRCIPSFVNAAFNAEVETTNTCGSPPIEFCRQTGVTGARKECDVCDSRDPNRAHPAKFLTDFSREDANDTWWQSETMLQNVQYPYTVNLTLFLRKAFDITYVRLRFHTSVPESFVIYKQTCDTCPWEPYQYYSASCETTYGVRTRDYILKDNVKKALCTNEFSDISPLTGANIAFSTLEGRPLADDFQHSPDLQDFVTATSVRITLNRLNTFGDEVFGDPKVLKSYYYAISDFAVGGRCKCNGHASNCVNSTGLYGQQARLVCQCSHNTTGPDCGECLPFYQDRPWGKGTPEDARECRKCECNGLSQRCNFDAELFAKTGRGGRCLDCQKNTEGPHCEKCKPEFYGNPDGSGCLPCYCHPVGSINSQCDATGRCPCKQGVGGDKCDRCLPNHFDFSPSGCRTCECDAAGSLNNNPSCAVNSGVCRCKERVEGANCDRCKPGYYDLNVNNEFGCTACFCFGHSSQCRVSLDYVAHPIKSDFGRSPDGWTAGDQHDLRSVAIDWSPENRYLTATPTRLVEPVYVKAPRKFLGDQKLSYNRFLNFRLRVTSRQARASRGDVVLQGHTGLSVMAPIFAQGNKLPDSEWHDYAFRLSEHANFQWTPKLTPLQFQSMLANLTAIKLRVNYERGEKGEIDDVELGSARRVLNGGGGDGGERFVERCTCPDGYIGQFCESCAPGFRRQTDDDSPLTKCVPCTCNGHSDTCDVKTGRCICKHNTVGDNCERCAPGYYGNPLIGSKDDCMRCPCPRGGVCLQKPDGIVLCTSCPDGYTGPRCNVCSDGYFGDLSHCETDRIGRRGCECRACECSGNIDTNAVANCDRVTGECLKCIHNTGGFHCEKCALGFYGSAHVPGSSCRPCDCHAAGTDHDSGAVFGPNAITSNAIDFNAIFLPSSYSSLAIACNQQTGQCKCHPHVAGRRCNRCQAGYWNLQSNRGCELCACDPTGSVNSECDLTSGQCACKSGVNGRTCSQCAVGFYRFSFSGCRDCRCDPDGSVSPQCSDEGQCVCKKNVEGVRCDRCTENMYGLKTDGGQCRACPGCYGLIQKKVNQHRASVEKFKKILLEGGDAGGNKDINDTEFENLLKDVKRDLDNLHQEVEKEYESKDGVLRRIVGLKSDLDRIEDFLVDLKEDNAKAGRQLDRAKEGRLKTIETVNRVEELLKKIDELIRVEGGKASKAAEEAQKKYEKEALALKEIADKTEKLAEKQKNKAEDISSKAKEALDKSKLAAALVDEALRRGGETKRELDELRRQFEGLKHRLETLEEDAENVYENAKMRKEEAEKIKKESADGKKPPTVDVEAIGKKSKEIKEEAEIIGRAAEKLSKDHRKTLKETYDEIEKAEKLFNDTLALQRVLDELVADADVAFNLAQNAKNEADAILREAEETLETLKNFNERVRKSKETADEALAKVGDIENMIEEAKSVTNAANTNLVDAGKDAEAAAEKAADAADIAFKAGRDAMALTGEIEETTGKARDVISKAEDLDKAVNVSEEKMTKMEATTMEDVAKAKAALQTAEAAGDAAQMAVKKSGDILETLEKLLRDLDDVEVMDPEELTKLLQELEEAEQTVKEMDLDKRIDGLEVAAWQQKTLIEMFEKESHELEEQVINVEQIRRALPEECYNYLSIENESSRRARARGRARRSGSGES